MRPTIAQFHIRINLKVVANLWATLILTAFCLIRLDNLAWSADFRPRVYVGAVTPDLSSTSLGQRFLFYQMIADVVVELRRNRDVIVDTEHVRERWLLDQDWEDVQRQGKTHFIVAIPKVEYESGLGAILRVHWEIGAFGTVAGKTVPVFAGDLSNGLETLISKEKPAENKAENKEAAVQLYIENDWRPQRLQNSVRVVANAIRRVFPELERYYNYYINCFDSDTAAPLSAQWSERRERLHALLLSKLQLHPRLKYSKTFPSPDEESRLVCGRGPDVQAITASDFHLWGGAKKALPQQKVPIAVTVENRASKRRLQDELTEPPRASTESFRERLREWSRAHEANSTWQLSICANRNDLLGTPAKLGTIVDLLARSIQDKMVPGESISVEKTCS